MLLPLLQPGYFGLYSNLQQLASSDPSKQSLTPSHIMFEWIQVPLSLHFTSPGILHSLSTKKYQI